MIIKFLLLIAILLTSAIVFASNYESEKHVPYKNQFNSPEDLKSRASVGYMLHRAWVSMLVLIDTFCRRDYPGDYH